jgi:CheY-like chemotaxis protein
VTEAHPKRRRQAAGLGLPITRQLVALHDGFVTLDSQPGQGSTFHVYLPLPNLLDSPYQADAATQPVMLLVSSADRSAPPPELVRFCDQQGLEIRQLRSGETLDRLLAEGRPAALAWDVTARNSSDRSLIERLRGHPSLCQLPFLVYGQGQEGQEGIGLTGFVTKPLEARSLVGAITALFPQPAASPILVVEDDAGARDYLSGLVLEQFPSYSVVMAADGIAALDILARQVPSLVVLDLILPGVDGFQVLEQMRADERTSRVPILILTRHLLTAGDLFRWSAAGELAVRIDRTWPLAEAASAHRYMESRQTKGKVLLIP